MSVNMCSSIRAVVCDGAIHHWIWRGRERRRWVWNCWTRHIVSERAMSSQITRSRYIMLHLRKYRRPSPFIFSNWLHFCQYLAYSPPTWVPDVPFTSPMTVTSSDHTNISATPLMLFSVSTIPHQSRHWISSCRYDNIELRLRSQKKNTPFDREWRIYDFLWQGGYKEPQEIVVLQ